MIFSLESNSPPLHIVGYKEKGAKSN